MCKLICVRGKAGDGHCMEVFLRDLPKIVPSNPTTQHEFAANIVHRTSSGGLKAVPLASSLPEQNVTEASAEEEGTGRRRSSKGKLSSVMARIFKRAKPSLGDSVSTRDHLGPPWNRGAAR